MLRKFFEKRNVPWILALSLLTSCASPVAVAPPPRVELGTLDTQLLTLIAQRLDAIRKSPADAARRAELGMVYAANSMVAAAQTAFEQAVALDESEPRWRYHLARVQAEQGSIDSALAGIDEVIRLDGRYVPAHRVKGEWLLELGRLDDADRAFGQALEIDGTQIGPRAGQARVYLQRGQEDLAIETLLPLIERLPRNSYLRRLLATAYRQQGDLDQARAELARAGEPEPPEWPDPWLSEIDRYRVGYAADFKRAMRLLNQRQFETAVPILERLRTQQPNDVTLLSNLGAAYVDLRRIDEGIATLEHARELDPDHFSTHLNLSAAFERIGDLERSLHHVDRALAANPQLSEAHLKRGQLLIRSKRYEESIQALVLARRYDARDARPLVWSGWVHCEMKLWPDALHDFKAALTQDPDGAWAHLGLALASAETGDLPEAEKALVRAEQLNPRDPQLPTIRRRIAEIRGAS